MSKVYFIATAHQKYRQRSFEPGSTVIDPWRMIPDQTDVTVRRLGENRPALISILVPSRGRPEAFAEMVESAFSTATHQRRVQVIAYLDNDDPNVKRKFTYPQPTKALNYLVGGRCLLSEAWNECAKVAKGEILMHGGDDVVFTTPGWDQQVRAAFAASQDKILLVQGDDLSPNREALATHGFVHRRWVETVGYFLPPLFSCDWNDVWLTEVADMIGRRRILPFVTEHRHHSFGLREKDETDFEREERGREDDVVGVFERTKGERKRDAEKLRKVMA